MRRRRVEWSVLGTFLLGTTATAQSDFAGATVHAAFAGAEQRGGLPALQWLCEQYLPKRADWPTGLSPTQPFAIELSSQGLRIRRTAVALPAGVTAAGDCSLDGSAPMLWSCRSDGCEDWFALIGFVRADARHHCTMSNTATLSTCAVCGNMLTTPAAEHL